jgi:hypothetical protein
MKVAYILFILFFVFSAYASTLDPQDSLDIMVSGGASITYEKSADAKALEDGLLRASLSHALTDNLRAVISIRGSRNSSIPLFEEGSIHLKVRNSDISGGFLSYRYGFATLYRPHSVFYLLFDRALLWDVNGFGIGGNLNSNTGLALGAGASLNSRESGQVHALLDVAGQHLQTRILGGFQSYSPEDQDNSFTEGTDVAGEWEYIKVHAVGTFMQYAGFGHATNSTMVPGNSFDGLVEARIDPNNKCNAEAQVYYENYKKSYRHEFLLTGIEATWMALLRCGIGAGYEYQMNDAYCTNIPRLFLDFIPFAQKCDVRLSFQQRTLSGSRPVYSLFGEIWMRF